MHRLHVVIRGRVQGVGFRYFVMRAARALDLTGWTRNRDDGTVEVEAEGARPSLDRLVERLRQGPPGAAVTSVETAWSEGEARFRRFDVSR